MSLISLEDKVITACRAHLPAHTSIVIAVSGGSDSIALLHLLHKNAINLHLERLVIAHVNYGLRGTESDADEALVRSIGHELQIPVIVRNFHGHSADEPGMEEWAREERYRFFNEVRREHDCAWIATGHTLEDQAETILMRLIRGSGVNGLRGIAAAREDQVIRPLIDVRKEEIMRWLESNGMRFRYDRSNGDTRFLRNRIRHELLPLLAQYNQNAAGHIAAVASQVQDILGEQQLQIDEWIRRNSLFTDDETLYLRRTAVCSGPSVAEALRQLFVRLGSTPDRYHITAVIDVCAKQGKRVLLPGAWRASAGKEYLFIDKKTDVCRRNIPVPSDSEVVVGVYRIAVGELSAIPEQLDQGPAAVYCNGDGIGDRLLLRTVTAADRFVPFGRRKPVLVTEFLAAQGVPLADRERAMILTTADNKPVWIFGIRLDERFRIDSSTKRVIKLQSSSILI